MCLQGAEMGSSVLDPYEIKPKNAVRRDCATSECGLVGGFVFGAESGQARMMQTIATHEVDHQQQ